MTIHNIRRAEEDLESDLEIDISDRIHGSGIFACMNG